MRFFAILLWSLVLPASAEDLAEVQIFVTPDCPIANSYAPEIARLDEAYTSEGVTIRLVYPEAGLSRKDVDSHCEEYGLKVEAVIDSDHALVKAAGATTTPEAAIFNHDGKLVYRGLIDNLYSDFGDRRRNATEHYLRDVLDALVAGKKVEFSETEPIGCLIEPLAVPLAVPLPK